MRTRPAGSPDRRGFALAVVVFLLFAIGIAGAAGYRAVRTEASLSLVSRHGAEAFSASQAGIERFMAEVRDTLPQQRTYSVLDAEAVVTPRRIFEGPFPNHRYLVRSVGIVRDARFGATAARRTTHRMVEHERVPVELLGALASPSEEITLDGVTVIGRDEATTGACPAARGPTLAGVVGGGTIDTGGGPGGGPGGGEPTRIQGDPPTRSYPGAQAVLDALEVEWDVLTDPSFPVEHDDTWPNFDAIPSDSFPTIRWNSNLQADEDRAGRGLLIVNGQLHLQSDFEWEGLILADGMRRNTSGQEFEIRGGLVVGLNGSGERFTIRNGGDIRFHSCHVIDAGRGLAHLEPLEATWWEAF